MPMPASNTRAVVKRRPQCRIMKRVAGTTVRCKYVAMKGSDVCRFHAGEDPEKADIAIERSGRATVMRRAWANVGPNMQNALMKQMTVHERAIYREFVSGILADNPELSENLADMTLLHGIALDFAKMTSKKDSDSASYQARYARINNTLKYLGIRRDVRLKNRGPKKFQTLADQINELQNELGGAVVVIPSGSMRKRHALKSANVPDEPADDMTLDVDGDDLAGDDAPDGFDEDIGDDVVEGAGDDDDDTTD